MAEHRRDLDEWLHRAGAVLLRGFGIGGPETFHDVVTDLTAVRSARRKSEVLVSWRAGDLLILDKVLAMHGRKPFEGGRRVLAAIA